MRIIHSCQKWPFTDLPNFLGEACSVWTKSNLENVISIFFSFLFSGGGLPDNLNQILGWSRMSSSWFPFLSNQSNILYVSVIKLVSQSDQTDIVQQSFFYQNNLCFHYNHIVFESFSCVNMYFRDLAMRWSQQWLSHQKSDNSRWQEYKSRKWFCLSLTLSESPLISLLWMEREAKKG